MKQISILLLFICMLKINIFAQQSDLITKVPFTLEGEHIFIKVKINNSEDLDFIFDTGAGGTVINLQTAEKVNLSATKQKTNVGAAGTINTQLIKKVLISINNQELDNINIHSIPLTHLERSLGRDIDGIIGYQLLKRYVLKINYDSFEIELYPFKGYEYDGKGNVIKIKCNTHSTINAQIKLENGEVFAGKFLLDNGAGIPLGLCTPFSEKNNIIDKFNKSYANNTVGLSNNETTVNKGRISYLKIHDFELLNVPTNIYKTKSGFFASKNVLGLIGNPILKKFNITFDYKRGKSYWEQNNLFYNEQFEVSCSGLNLSLDSTKTKVIIEDIYLNSVGAKSDLEIGDEIIEINGIKASETSLMKIEEMLRKDGKVVDIKCKRDILFISVKIVLKAMI